MVIYTWRRVRVLLWKRHLSLEIPSIVERVWIDNDESDMPVKDVVVVKLESY